MFVSTSFLEVYPVTTVQGYDFKENEYCGWASGSIKNTQSFEEAIDACNADRHCLCVTSWYYSATNIWYDAKVYYGGWKDYRVTDSISNHLWQKSGNFTIFKSIRFFVFYKINCFLTTFVCPLNSHMIVIPF